MRILLSTEDLIELVTQHAFTSLVPTAKGADVAVGILDGQIVAAVAVGEDNFRLKSVADLQAPLVSGSTPVAEQEEAEQEEEHDDDNQDEQETDKPVKRRKRRTKAEIEADKAAEEAAAQAEVEAEAEAQTESEEDLFAETSDADNAAPFDIDEGANLRAENELLPEAKDAAVAEEVDPFADAGLAASEGDELFAQADTPVTKVVETSEAGFAKPADTEDDPFANFD
jgi:ribonuclease E